MMHSSKEDVEVHRFFLRRYPVDWSATGGAESLLAPSSSLLIQKCAAFSLAGLLSKVGDSPFKNQFKTSV